MRTVYNIYSEADAKAIIFSVYDKIAQVLDEDNFLFPENEDKIKLNFPAIIVYAYLKEGLVLLADTEIIGKFNKDLNYNSIRSFMHRFEEALKNNSFVGSFVPLTTRELNTIAEKYTEKSKLQNPYKNSLATQIKSDEQKKIDKTRKVVIIITVATFMIYLNTI